MAALYEAFIQAVQKPDHRRFPSRLLQAIAEFLEASSVIVLRGAADDRLHIADAIGDAVFASESWSIAAEDHLDRRLGRFLRPRRGERVLYVPLLRHGHKSGILAASLPASRPLRDLQAAAAIWSLAVLDVEEDIQWKDRVDARLRDHYRLQGWAEMARGLHTHVQQMAEVQESALEMLVRGNAELSGSPVLQTLVNSQHELRRMAVRLRQFNRLVSSTPAFRTVSMTALVRLAVQRMRTKHPGVRFRLSYPSKSLIATDPNILADPEIVLPGILEILQNAVEFGNGYPVSLEISTRAGVVSLAVRSRSSMAPTVQQHVFELFYTTHPNPARGLGLPITLAIALLHRGSVFCTTSSKFTTIYFNLPLVHP